MHRTRNDRGQAIVEFTLMLPFFLLLIFAIAEFGLALYTQITVRNSASEAARYAAVANLPSATAGTCAADSIEERAWNTSNQLVDCDEITVTYHNPDATSGLYLRGSGVAVHISHVYNTITPLPAIVSLISGGLFPTTWTLGACSDSRLESVPSNQTLVAARAGADCS
ncbi:MAG: TadE/TadG family type IV pilus assembly protein [Dehalococcoidia bacterium]